MKTTEIRIVSPCGQDFRAMHPTGKGRYCDTCKKTVHDLSAMSSREARELLSLPRSENLCVRYLYDVHGEIAFRGVPAGALVRARRAVAVAAVVALPLSLAACGAASHREMMGTAPYIPPATTDGGGPAAQPGPSIDAQEVPANRVSGAPASLR
jgi:hypothetical protein